ncbi:uncharacterized protein RCC_03715 [Ramularia collo-cygni]|uniref:Ubiquitin-like domain-containing protein n=1 Tax=Ramularia collo-cygni TaxID=112498 RepID=A0A2D3V8Q6_9PEZI|nr:uncharacterized protein RCC_03715 [Ramularia collo-cygni]CZT17879.1 uncharacterized protein RCC_03715 [Ramularia collo-cygni]
MSLSISLSLPLSLATSIHASQDLETGSLTSQVQQSIIRSIVTAIKSLPSDTSTWNLELYDSPKQISAEEAEQEERERSSASPPSPRVSFTSTDTYIPNPRPAPLRKRRSSLKNGKNPIPNGQHHHHSILHPNFPNALQKPFGPDISFPNAHFVFEVRRQHDLTRSFAVAAHESTTTAELALAIWKLEGVAMREQKLYFEGHEIYNGEAHERDVGYESVRLRGKFRHIRQGSIVILVVTGREGERRTAPRTGLGF